MTKTAVFSKKLLRVFGNNLRTPFTGGAEAHNGTPDGATERGSSDQDGGENTEVDEAGGASKFSAVG